MPPFLHVLGGRAGASSLSVRDPLEVSLYGFTKIEIPRQP